jgi:hypothetical protein
MSSLDMIEAIEHIQLWSQHYMTFTPSQAQKRKHVVSFILNLGNTISVYLSAPIHWPTHIKYPSCRHFGMQKIQN